MDILNESDENHEIGLQLICNALCTSWKVEGIKRSYLESLYQLKLELGAEFLVMALKTAQKWLYNSEKEIYQDDVIRYIHGIAKNKRNELKYNDEIIYRTDITPKSDVSIIDDIAKNFSRKV